MSGPLAYEPKIARGSELIRPAWSHDLILNDLCSLFIVWRLGAIGTGNSGSCGVQDR